MIRKIICLVGVLVLMCSVAVAGEKTATFTWEQEITSDFAGWNLYHSTDGAEYNKFAFIEYNGTKQETYSADKKLESADGKEVEHYFYMTALDEEGNESAKSNTVSAVIDFKSPNTPFTLNIEIVKE